MALVAILTSAAMSLGLVKAPAPLVLPQPDPVISTPSPGGSGPMAGAPPAPPSLPDPPRSLLACIRWWESRNNYRAISPGGRYRNAYQFDLRTWLGVGGSGDPALATPAEQDYRAALLVGMRGLAPWPTPARRCA